MLHARSEGENGHEVKRLTVRAASREEKKHRSDRALLCYEYIINLVSFSDTGSIMLSKAF